VSVFAREKRAKKASETLLEEKTALKSSRERLRERLCELAARHGSPVVALTRSAFVNEG
jgi:regulator of replication initiation timing